MSAAVVLTVTAGPAGAGTVDAATAGAVVAAPSVGDGPTTPSTAQGLSGRRSTLPAQPQHESSPGNQPQSQHVGAAAINPAGNPVANIAPNPAFPARCYQAYQSVDCTTAVVAALNNARRVIGQPSYLLPASFAQMTPAYQFLVLSNADRVLAGRTPITAFNPTLNAVAQQAANGSTDPTGPDTVDGVNTKFWTANWAGGMSPLEAYYDWMYYDGYGSNNIDCTSATDQDCWGHRENTLWNFGSDEVAMGVGVKLSGASYGTSFSELYWSYSPTGTRIPRLPTVVSVAATGGPAAGGTRVTLRGNGLETATAVYFGSRTAPPLYRSATSIIVATPPGTGVVPVRVMGDGGLGPATPVATFSYLAGAGPGSFVPLSPNRLLDTRSGLGALKTPVPSKKTLRLPVLGHGGVPSSGVDAVVLNVSAVAPTVAGFLTVSASTTSPAPRISNLAFNRGQTVANLVVAQVGHDGKVAMYNGSGGTVDLIADVSGYYLAAPPKSLPTAAGSFTSVVPTRLVDTRVAPATELAASGTARITMTGRAGIPTSGVSAVVVNVTAVNPAAPGYFTVYASGGARPTSSNLNFVARQTVPNLVVSPVGSDGRIALFNGSRGSVDLLIDVIGYVRAGAANTRGAIIPVTPARLFDSRTGVGIGTSPPYDFTPPMGQTYIVSNQYRVPLAVTGRQGVPATGVSAVVLNVTVVAPAAPGYYTVYPDGLGIPGVSNLNFTAGRTVPNLVIVPVARNGLVNLYNGSTSYGSLIVDVAGYVLG
ncbi:hypothetical protein ABIB25_000808 [Nakamurella sp. UYEF19]|uniref:IPT/TIG domain-containing protein n=1 Tax=Nakamurella sp. UYEF19 TaxID=1756392 RepID=UPI003393814A